MDIKVSIAIIEGEDRGKSFSLTQERTVSGRNRGDILLSDRKVSGEHLCLFVKGSKLFAEDLASTNGSMLNDEPIEKPVQVKNLDEIG